MRYYYKKVRDKGKYKDKHLKICVDDSTAGTKKDPWKIIDASFVDEPNKDEKIIYQKSNKGSIER